MEQQFIVGDPKFKMLQKSLGLFYDGNKILRCKGRISNANLPYVTKFPAILPKDHHLTSHIIRQSHERVMHNGVKKTLCSLREKYWIARRRQVVKREIHMCNVCRKLEGKPYASPDFHVSEEYPFSHTGVEFAGPIYVKTSVRKETEMTKSYIALYTCASTQAVHLEIVPNQQQINLYAFWRFTSHRGVLKLMVSDNTKTFKSTENKLSALFDFKEVQEYFLAKRIQWKYNLEEAPWWGGFWGRMVKSTKHCLEKVLRNARLSYDELTTILMEVEVVLNSRPQAYVEAEGIEEALTPSHLMLGRRIHRLPDPVISTTPVSNVDTLTRRFRYLTKLSNHFWNRWRHEYLLSLREHHKGIPNVQRESVIKTGDIVCIYEDSVARRFWRLGKVKELVQGSDGQVKGAAIKLGDKGKRSNIIRRPSEAFPT